MTLAPLAVSFASPAALLGLLAIPALILLAVGRSKQRDKYAMRFPAAASLALAAGPEDAYRRWIPSALALAALAALIFAAAHPRQTVRVPLQEASIVLVTDHSGSMSATDVQPNRLEAAKGAAKAFVKELPDAVRLGIVTYSSSADEVQPPSTNHAAIIAAIERQVANDATATGDALDVAVGLVRPKKTTRTPAAIVLLSDGANTRGGDPIDAAARAKAAGVPVYTVALGTDSATIPDPADPFGPGQTVAPDPQTLRRMSELTGGQAFTAQDSGRLGAIYKSLGSKLGSKAETRDAFGFPIAAGLVLLVAAGGLALRRRVVT